MLEVLLHLAAPLKKKMKLVAYHKNYLLVKSPSIAIPIVFEFETPGNALLLFPTVCAPLH